MDTQHQTQSFQGGARIGRPLGTTCTPCAPCTPEEFVADSIAAQGSRINSHADDLRGIAERLSKLANGLIGNPPDMPENGMKNGVLPTPPGAVNALREANNNVERSIGDIRTVLSRLGV